MGRGVIAVCLVLWQGACGNDKGGLNIGTFDGSLGTGGGFGGGASGGSAAGGGAGGAATGGNPSRGGGAPGTDGPGPVTGGTGAGGGAPGDAPGGSSSAEIERACEGVARLCERINACAPVLLQLIWGDVKTCTERAMISCRADLMAPGTGATPAAFTACAEAIGSASCADIFENRVGACQVRGSVESGRPCGTDGQCATGHCRRNAGELCGICALRSGVGGVCRKDKNEDCERGLICSAAERCAPPGARGAACAPDKPCGWGLYCSRAGICAESATSAGAPCTGEDGSCAFAKGLFCNQNARVCQVLKVAQPGEACGFTLNPPTVCSGGAFERACRPNTLSGVCLAPAREGEACGLRAMGRDCLSPAECMNGTCALPSPSSCR